MGTNNEHINVLENSIDFVLTIFRSVEKEIVQSLIANP